MSWAGLANNQIVSFNNLQDAVNTGQFTALAAIPVSNEEITKTDASTYVNCWTSYSLFANKASNQLIAKRDLVTTTSTTTTTTEPTTTTTTTTASSLSYFIGFGGAPEDACNFLATGTIIGDDASFCACTTFTGSIFAAAPTGTWYVSYNGVYQTVNVTNGNPVATVIDTCQFCNAYIVAQVYVSNGSTDIPITNVTVNGVSLFFVYLNNFTLFASQGGLFKTNERGVSCTVSLYYGSNSGGQSILFQDNYGNITCHDVSSGGGVFTITGVDIQDAYSLNISAIVYPC